MSLKTKLAATAAAAVALCSVSQAYAASPDEYALVDVRMLISTTCGFANASVVGGTGSGAATNQGLMDFNTQVAGYNDTGPQGPVLDRQAMGVANKAPLAAVCATGSNAFVTVSAENAASATTPADGWSTMILNGANKVDYTVSTDQAGNNLIEFDTNNDNFGNAVTTPPTGLQLVQTITGGNGPTIIPIWGHVAMIPNASAPGLYTDVLHVNLFIQ